MRYELTKEKYLSEKELAELTRVLERFKDRDPRNCNLLFLALHTGARASEILNITRKDFDSDDGSVYIRSLKGGRDREIPIPRWLVKRLAGMPPNEDGRLFSINYCRFKQVWWLYRPAKKKLHSLRHTFALNLYNRTKDLMIVKVALGHNSVATTMIYLDYHYTKNELRRAILGGTNR